MKLPQIIIDTNIVYSAQRSTRGASAKLMSLVGTRHFEIHVSTPLVLEYEDVLSRNRSTLGLTQEDVTNLVDALCALAQRHQDIHFRWRPFLPDDKDEFILDLAVAAQCDYIITYNIKDFKGTEKFGIKVTDPKTFLLEIGVLS